MARKIRNNKRRDALTADAIAWLAGEPCGFFEFKPDDELLALWEAFGDADVATWDMGRDSKPRPVAE